jgi:mannose-6-phosphate isomerase-like protein (cupin superfamily)
MRRLIAALPLFVAAASLAGDPPVPAEYRGAAEVARVRAGGENGGTLISHPDFRVMALRRDKVGESEIHENETDIFVVVAGKATIVLGGTLVNPKVTAPGEIRGSAIEGGKDYLLEPGVVLTVPRNTPHWVRETQPGFHYYVIKSAARR